MTLPKELTTITPISKFLTLVLLLSLPFVGFLVGLKYQQQFIEYLESRASVDQYLLKTQPVATQSASTASPAPNGDRANWKTYRSEKFGFEMKYSEEFVVKENIENVGGVVLGYGETIDVLIGFPDSVYGTTSLSHGALHINRIFDSEEDCRGYEYSDSPPTVKIINGISFTETSFGDGAMGLDHEEKQYNTKYKGICYQIERVIVTKGYYKEVGATWMDPKEVEQKLDQILSTFKFTPASPTGGDQENQVVCTQDVKQCPDGSYVSRQPPTCEFAACPQR